MRNKWTLADMPAQEHRHIVVTGANSGLGFESAKALAAKGATVMLACRSLDKARDARDRIERVVPGARLEVASLDLGSLARLCWRIPVGP